MADQVRNIPVSLARYEQVIAYELPTGSSETMVKQIAGNHDPRYMEIIDYANGVMLPGKVRSGRG